MGIKKTAACLSLAFMCAAMPAVGDYTYAARDTEPYSCKINGRTYNPQPASIAIDVKTGEILSGSHIDEPRYPASMTKMMALALIFEALKDGRLKLDGQIMVRISPDIAATHRYSHSTWLADGTKLTVREAIKAITVASANNVTVLLAERLAGSQAAFVRKMNRKAREIGMTNTVFRNATGLPDRHQVSTARDMAKLALYLYRTYPQYYHFFSAHTAEFGPWRGRRAKVNHNELVVKNRDIDGLKTGFICDSGYNLAASSFRGGDRVISVVFGGRTPQKRNVLTDRLMSAALDLLARRDHNPRLAAAQGKFGYIGDNENKGPVPPVANAAPNGPRPA